MTACRRITRTLTLPALVAGILVPSAVYGTAHHQAAHRTTLAAVQAPAPLDAMNIMAVTRLTAVRAEVAREERAEARAEARRQHEAVLLAAQAHARAVQTSRTEAAAAARVTVAVPEASGAQVYNFAGIEALWLAAGGNPAYASTAACIAEHESGGRANAISPTDDFGVFQIHADPAALNPQTSTEAAIRMSGNGTNWSQWTTAGSC